MRSIPRFIAVLLLAIIAIVGSAQAQKKSKKYPIKINRPREVGQTYVINSVVTTRQQLSASMGGSLIRKEDSSYTLRLFADARVTDSDPVQGSTHITYTVMECIRVSGSDTIVLAAPGTELLFVKGKGGKSLRSKDESIDEDVLDDIDDAITEIGLGSEGMGDYPPKAVGEKWSLGDNFVSKGFMEGGDMVITDKGVKAVATLAEVSEAAAIPSMKMKVDVTMKDFKLKQLSQYKIPKSNAVITLVGELPLDETRGPLAVSLSMTFNIKASGRPEPEMPKIDMEMRFTREAVTRFTYY